MLALEIQSPWAECSPGHPHWHKPYTPQAICPWDQVSSLNKLTGNRSAESLQGAQQFALSLPTASLCLPEKSGWKGRGRPKCGGLNPKLCSSQPELWVPTARAITSLPRGNAKRSWMIMTPLPWGCFCWEQWSSHGTSGWLEILVLSEREHSCV